MFAECLLNIFLGLIRLTGLEMIWVGQIKYKKNHIYCLMTLPLDRAVQIYSDDWEKL